MLVNNARQITIDSLVKSWDYFYLFIFPVRLYLGILILLTANTYEQLNNEEIFLTDNLGNRVNDVTAEIANYQFARD